ncbi:hypothetical protein Tco_0278470 [Tanacetum coccineum]
MELDPPTLLPLPPPPPLAELPPPFLLGSAHVIRIFIRLEILLRLSDVCQLFRIAITLERYLSYHRPILLRESWFDYGPSPFHFYHHWLEVDGFNNFVEDMWSVAPSNNSNPLCSMAMKLKFLKLKIKQWNQRNMKDLKSGKAKLKEDLEALDADIGKGNGTADMVTKRSEVVNLLQEIDKLQTMEIAQKAKIKWCIEGEL